MRLSIRDLRALEAVASSVTKVLVDRTSEHEVTDRDAVDFDLAVALDLDGLGTELDADVLDPGERPAQLHVCVAGGGVRRARVHGEGVRSRQPCR